ncbi:diguanylate cyclase domain-containing protein, partial [Frankia casuarinae]|uniref:diguanylate cyclase domain-containing protein n=1 Tax=Frankia casuarinae (strain DSM 45818 / CECT 9043 / HFP020203 / CcI3) TaxID=106370 RepID=UPI0036F24DB6
MHHQALHDPLTDLANRTLLTARLQRGLARRLHDNTQDDTQLALLFCDLDDFKSVNDRFGHAAGDDLLRVTAGRLTSCARSTDTVARIS